MGLLHSTTASRLGCSLQQRGWNHRTEFLFVLGTVVGESQNSSVFFASFNCWDDPTYVCLLGQFCLQFDDLVSEVLHLLTQFYLVLQQHCIVRFYLRQLCLQIVSFCLFDLKRDVHVHSSNTSTMCQQNVRKGNVKNGGWNVLTVVFFSLASEALLSCSLLWSFNSLMILFFSSRLSRKPNTTSLACWCLILRMWER